MNQQTNREEHLNWCKKRALAYVEAGDIQQAFTSMASDLNKHPDTHNHSAIKLGMSLLAGGYLSTSLQMKEFIEGFH